MLDRIKHFGNDNTPSNSLPARILNSLGKDRRMSKVFSLQGWRTLRLGRLAAALLVVSTILTGDGAAEKSGRALRSEWEERIERQRQALSRAEVETRTWRYDLRDATSAIRFEDGERYLEHIASWLVESGSTEVKNEHFISDLVRKSAAFFGGEPKITEVLTEVHQLDLQNREYKVWEKSRGWLSVFNSRGTWHQDDGSISIGPPGATSEIEICLASLGLFLPHETALVEVLSTTPEDNKMDLEYQLDLEDSHFLFGCRPWLGSGSVYRIEEYSVWEKDEKRLLEKRVWFPVLGVFKTDPQESVHALPRLGVEHRYDLHGNLTSYAIHHITALRLDPSDWIEIPKERPPFGWPVLDYRFEPEVEFRFGDYR